MTCDTCSASRTGRGLCSLGAGRTWEGVSIDTSLGPLPLPGVGGGSLGRLGRPIERASPCGSGVGCLPELGPLPFLLGARESLI